MKHIKQFESIESDKIRDYFKNKINWKFYNYLLDSLTEYEDIGYEVQLNTVLINSRGLYYTIHTKNKDEDYYGMSNNVDQLKDVYFYNQNISFIIWIYSKIESGYLAGKHKYHVDILKKLYNNIKDKCSNTEMKDNCMIVTPK